MKDRKSEGLWLFGVVINDNLKKGMIMMNVHVIKTVPIEFKQVVEAYRKVRKGGKAVGIDGESWTEFDKNPERNLYVIWNRLASGSYHPQAEELWDITKEVMDTRKNLYFYDNPERAKDYMITVLKRRVNNERTEKTEKGETVVEKGILDLNVYFKSNDEPAMGVEYEVVETGDIDLTDQDGDGGLELAVGKYTLKMRMEGFVEQTISFEIKKDETTELTIKMEAVATT